MLSDDDLRDILNPAARSPKASMLNPVTVGLDAAELVAMLESVVGRVDDSARGDSDASDGPVDRQRLLDFLEWARGRSGTVSVSLYPAGEDGLDDLEFPDDSGPDAIEDLPF